MSNARPAGTGLRNLAIRELDATDECVALASTIEGLEVLMLDGIDATRGIVDAILGGAAAASLTSISIRYCAYAPRATALRACDVLRLVQGCPRLCYLSWFCDEEFQKGTLLLWGVCREITRLLESRGGRVAMRPRPTYSGTSRNQTALWDKLRSEGWTWRKGTGLTDNFWYLRPGVKGRITDLEQSVDYFGVEELWVYADTHGLWPTGDSYVPTRVLVPGDEREPEVLFSCLYNRATELYY